MAYDAFNLKSNFLKAEQQNIWHNEKYKKM